MWHTGTEPRYYLGKVRNPIKRFRLMKGWLQEKMAFELDVSRETVCRWENDVQGVSLESYLKLKKLGVEL